MESSALHPQVTALVLQLELDPPGQGWMLSPPLYGVSAVEWGCKCPNNLSSDLFLCCIFTARDPREQSRHDSTLQIEAGEAAASSLSRYSQNNLHDVVL